MNVHKNNTMSTIYDVQRGSNNNKNLLLLVFFLTHMWFWALPFFRCILLLYTSLNFYYCKEKVLIVQAKVYPSLSQKKTPIMWFDIWGTLILYFYFLYFYFQIRSLGNKKDCRCDNNNYLAIGRICLLRTNILWPP